jgi:hypothetical protein
VKKRGMGALGDPKLFNKTSNLIIQFLLNRKMLQKMKNHYTKYEKKCEFEAENEYFTNHSQWAAWFG